ncbi:MAG: hypothetical protein KDB84_05595, partial [Flavobacteriales bacterium]|nr:hypothetical protein [Flavobacteriales bacterium]
EEVCYGITHPPRTWDPIFINFQYWKQLFSDAWHTARYWDKVRIWFMPTGWRPADLRTGPAPAVLGYTLSDQHKFRSEPFTNLSGYLVAQVVLGLAYMYITIDMAMPLVLTDRLLLIMGLFLMIISWGGILQARKWSIPLEILRLLFMAATLILILDRNGILPWTSWLTTVVAAATGVSMLYFSFQVRRSAALERTKETDPRP